MEGVSQTAKKEGKGQKPGKTNKTAHVLNLLVESDAQDGGEPVGADEAVPAAAISDPGGSQVESQIITALEQELLQPDEGADQDGPAPEEQPLADVCCVNVMQTLVEEKVDKYIKLFGLCTCARCRIDVVALALTSLPAKYAVAEKSKMIPMLTVYEGRYNAAVISQIMWACKKVMDNPRHSS